MELKDSLRLKSHGINYDNRKQHIESMEKLAEEGYKNMEIRASEISQEDLQYFRDQGMMVQVVDGDIPYFKIIWEHDFSPIVEGISTTYAYTFKGLEVILKALTIPLLFIFKFFKLFIK